MVTSVSSRVPVRQIHPRPAPRLHAGNRHVSLTYAAVPTGPSSARLVVKFDIKSRTRWELVRLSGRAPRRRVQRVRASVAWRCRWKGLGVLCGTGRSCVAVCAGVSDRRRPVCRRRPQLAVALMAASTSRWRRSRRFLRRWQLDRSSKGRGQTGEDVGGAPPWMWRRPSGLRLGVVAQSCGMCLPRAVYSVCRSLWLLWPHGPSVRNSPYVASTAWFSCDLRTA